MTQAMAQIGKVMLIEFVKMIQDRNKNSTQYYWRGPKGSASFSLFVQTEPE
jgi:hypothetical protein